MKSLFQLMVFLVRSPGERAYSTRSLVVVMVMSVIAGAATSGLLALINTALDPEARESPALAWGFLALCIALPVCRFLSSALLLRLAQGISFDMRMRLGRRILSSPLRQLERLGAPRLLATLTDDIGAISGSLLQIPTLLLHLTIVTGCLVYMAYLSWPLFGLVLACVFLGVLTYQLPLIRATRHFRDGREAWDSVLGSLRGLTDGSKELKIHRPRREALLSDSLEPAAQDLRHHRVVAGTIYAAAGAWGQTLFFIVIGLLLFVLPDRFPVVDQVATGYVLAILYMLTPLNVLLNALPNLGRATVAVEKVQDLGLALDSESSDAGEEPVLPPGEPGWKTLELRGVQHTFYREDADDMFTLGPIDLRIERGEQLYVVGGNGSGKTTLAKLLVGLYAPEAGEVLLDGRPITDAKRDSFRQLFSVVFSDFFLFETLLGLDRETLDERASRYLEKLHLGNKVEVIDGALSTIELSQGQRKRLALLTAYLEDREIFVFDEWAADQDPYFKDIFYRQLVPELQARGKTVVIISHDDGYYHLADRILKLEHGKMLYDGTTEDYLDSSSRLPMTAEAGSETSLPV